MGICLADVGRVPLLKVRGSTDRKVMSLFQWSEEFSVGYSDIDSQHKRLFQLAEQLHVAMTGGKGKECVGNTLNNLIAYTKRHFADEEILMQTHRYPAYPQHKALHQALTQKVVQFQQAFAAGKATVTMDLLHFLRDWLTQHIGVVDKKVAAFLREQAR